MTAIATSAALAALVVAALDTGPLPPARYPNCAVDLWPEHNLERIEVGGYEFQAYETFGRRNTRPPLLDSLEPRRCVAFVYDENILWNPPLALTVLIDHGRVADRWLAPLPFSRQECAGLPRETVNLKGYFHAAACW